MFSQNNRAKQLSLECPKKGLLLRPTDSSSEQELNYYWRLTQCFGRARKINLVDLKKRSTKFSKTFENPPPPPSRKSIRPCCKMSLNFTHKNFCRFLAGRVMVAADKKSTNRLNSLTYAFIFQIHQRVNLNRRINLSIISSQTHKILIVFLGTGKKIVF